MSKVRSKNERIGEILRKYYQLLIQQLLVLNQYLHYRGVFFGSCSVNGVNLQTVEFGTLYGNWHRGGIQVVLVPQGFPWVSVPPQGVRISNVERSGTGMWRNWEGVKRCYASIDPNYRMWYTIDVQGRYQLGIIFWGFLKEVNIILPPLGNVKRNNMKIKGKVLLELLVFCMFIFITLLIIIG